MPCSTTRAGEGSVVGSTSGTQYLALRPLLADGFDLSAVPIDLFVNLVSLVPIPYLKTLASHGETLLHVAAPREIGRGG